MKEYYDNLINEIQQYIHNKDYDKAYSLCKEELDMLYVPLEMEKILTDLMNTCIYYLNEKKHNKYTQEDIEDLFNKDDNHKLLAIELLKNSNVRNYIDMIEKYLNDKPNPLLRSYLIELLIEQGVHETIKLNYDGLDVEFSPIYAECVQDQDAYNNIKDTLKEYYENENPVFLSMCLEILYVELLYRQPFSVEYEEEEMLLYALLKYVYKANNQVEEFNKLVEEKSLAKYNSYALSLCRYEN